MVEKTSKTVPVSEFGPLFAEKGEEDASSHAHRLLIGHLGMFLPVALWVMSGWRPTTGLPHWRNLDSISAYYYSGAVTIFVGVLVVLAVYLFTYNGYRNADKWKDRLTAIVAGAAAVGVAVFPTGAPDKLTPLSWWAPWVRTVHYVSVGVLFGSFIVFSLFLFRKSNVQDPALVPADKRARNNVYIVCGLAMLVCMGWIAIAAAMHKPVFWPETLALEFFAVSWLVKGRAGWTLREVHKRTRSYAKHPKRLAGDIRKSMSS